MDEQFRKRIELLVDKAGGQSAFARATNMSLGAIQRYLKGGDPTRLALIRLAKAGNVSLSWLIYGDEGQMEISSEAKPKYKMYGFSEPSGDGWQEPFAYRVRTELEWPDPECFAVLVGDNALQNEGIRKDFTCYVSPNTRPQPGDVVFIKHVSGGAAFKIYLREDQDWVFLKGYSHPDQSGTQTTFEEQVTQSDIEQIAPVVFVKRR